MSSRLGVTAVAGTHLVAELAVLRIDDLAEPEWCGTCAARWPWVSSCAKSTITLFDNAGQPARDSR